MSMRVETPLVREHVDEKRTKAEIKFLVKP
jgi:hypothetical protein